jgi:hypothetical protein
LGEEIWESAVLKDVHPNIINSNKAVVLLVDTVCSVSGSRVASVLEAVKEAAHIVA